MSWIRDHQRAWRIVLLIVLVVAWIGPWTYDLINVPAEYACNPPFYRLEGDYCGTPLTGLYIILAIFAGLLAPIPGVFSGTVPIGEWARQILLSIKLFSFVLPLISTLLLVRRNTRRRQIFNWIAWGLAAVLVVPLTMLSPEQLHPRLWGIWLFRVVVIAALLFEMGTNLPARRRMVASESQP